MATPIRSPIPCEQPIDWEPICQHRAVTDTTLIPSSASSRMHINPIGYALHQEFIPSEVSDSIREGLQLGAQQRARNNSQNSGRESMRLEHQSKKDLNVKREFHPTILLFLILCLIAGSGVHLLVPSYLITSLLFNLENFLGYLHASAKITLITSRVIPTLYIVPTLFRSTHTRA
jgi:hypothetical protein